MRDLRDARRRAGRYGQATPNAAGHLPPGCTYNHRGHTTLGGQPAGVPDRALLLLSPSASPGGPVRSRDARGPAKRLGRILMPHTRGLADAFGDSVNGRSGAVAGVGAGL